MKTAIFIREDKQQVVLTPENEWERNICKTLAISKNKSEMYFGQFTDVQGGWIMNSQEDCRGKENNSLIIVLSSPQESKEDD